LINCDLLGYQVFGIVKIIFIYFSIFSQEAKALQTHWSWVKLLPFMLTLPFVRIRNVQAL